MVASIGSIYIISTTQSPKRYIGQTINVSDRWHYHKWSAKRESSMAIHSAMRKYGASSFTMEVIWTGPVDLLDEMERKYIEQYNTLTPNGYNLRTGGGRPIWTDEARAKLSAAVLANYAANPSILKKIGASLKAAHQADPTIRQRISPLGRSPSKETRDKLSAANKGKHPINEQMRQEMRERATGKIPSSETREKMRQSRLRRPFNPVACEAMRQANLGKTRSLETRKKISDSRRGRKSKPFSAETCQKISDKAKARWADPEKRKLLTESIKAGFALKHLT